MRKNSKSALIVATLPLLILTGCSAARNANLRPVALPAPPSCMAPVELPKIEVGMDAREALARHRAALKGANGRLECSRDWYSEVRRDYAKQ